MDNHVSHLMVSTSPHIRDSATAPKIMGTVVIALLPALVAAVVIFGLRALLVVAVTVGSAVLMEYLWCQLRHLPNTVHDGSAVVTGLLLAFNLPSTIPLWMAVVGAFVAIILTKELFGGIGRNFANPAIVGRIVLAVSFTGRMTAYAYPATLSGVDALSSATPLAARGASLPYLDLLLGTHGGVLGETCALALLIGGVFLIVVGTIRPTIPAVYLATVAVFSLLAGRDPVVQLLSGGLMLGAFFMATDYTTSPYTTKGQVIYGIGLGVITCVIRFWGNLNEGVSYAILLMNLLTPYLNQLTRPRPLGTGGAKKA
jgi:electron transport complex protein RnfD